MENIASAGYLVLTLFLKKQGFPTFLFPLDPIYELGLRYLYPYFKDGKEMFFFLFKRSVSPDPFQKSIKPRNGTLESSYENLDSEKMPLLACEMTRTPTMR